MSGISGPSAQIKDHELIKRILAEVSNYHMHGDMSTHDDGLQVSLPTAGSEVVSTGWTAGDSTGAGFVVSDAANGTITIGDKGAGRYQINGNFSFSSTKAASVIHGAIYIDGVKEEKFAFKRKIGNANDVGNASFPSLTCMLAAGQVVEMRFESDTNTTVLDIEHGGWGIIWKAGE